MKSWHIREDDLLWQMYADLPTARIAKALRRTSSSVYQRARIIGLRKSDVYLSTEAAGRLRGGKGVQFRFKKGQTPWNAGKKGWQAGGRSADTRFKKGQILGAAAQRLRPVGSIYLDKDGCTLVKVSETGDRRRDWRSMHVMAWEEMHGPVPKGHIVTRDLRCLSRAELMGQNTCHRYPADLKFAMRLVKKLGRKIRDAEKQNDGPPQPSVRDAGAAGG